MTVDRYIKTLMVLFCVICIWAPASAQNSRIKGLVTEQDTGSPAIQAAVQILSQRDSTAIDGTVTDAEGRFSFVAPSGDYIIKVSYIGFVSQYRLIHNTPSKEGLDVGVIGLIPEQLVLRSSVVSAKAQPVTVLEDTLVFNSAAFNLAEDDMLEDLLKKIPGMEVDRNGNVSLHGKVITELYVDGKRFFGGDVRTGLKNISADMVDKVHAYERESDFTRATGIDDGETQPVLDLKIKKNMLDGWRGQTNIGGGTSDMYAGRINANKITKNDQTTVIANINDLPAHVSSGTTSRSQLGSGSNGKFTSYEAGVTFARNRKGLELDASAHIYGNNRRADSRNRSQSILASGGSWTNANNSTGSKSLRPKLDMRVNWRPNKQWSINFKPNFQFTYSGTETDGLSGNFRKDPYEVVDDPNDWVAGSFSPDPLKDLRNNSVISRNISFTDRYQSNITLSVVYRFNSKRGRNISMYVQNTLNNNYSDTFYASSTRYYRIKSNPDSVLFTKRYIDTPTKSSTWHAQISFNEPVGKHFYLQLLVRADIRRNSTDRQLFNLAGIAPEWTPGADFSRKSALENLPSNYLQGATVRGGSMAGGVYDYYATIIQPGIRYIRKKFNLSAGFKFIPQHSTLNTYGDNPTLISKNFSNFSPNVNLNYKPGKTKKLAFTYNSWASMPSMYNLLPVENFTNPLYVHYGNPDLQAPFLQRATLSYNSSDIRKQSSIIINALWNNTLNAVSNSTEYNADTGGRTYTPKNIDGNWYATLSLVMNKSFKDTFFSISNHTNARYDNNVSYLYNNKLKVDEENLVRRFMVKDYIDLSYRLDWLELILNGGVEYSFENSKLRPDMNQQPLILSAGCASTFTLPWKMRFKADYSFLSQRGYVFSALNRNYHILDLSLSQPILKKKATIRLDCVDLLGQQENLIGTFNAESRNVNTYSGVNRYIILRFIYKFKFS